MLEIGHNKKLTYKSDWKTSRDEWLLSGNVLYKMVSDLMKQKVVKSAKEEIDNYTINRPAMTYIIKDELLKVVEVWCHYKDIEDKTVGTDASLSDIAPKSITELTELVEACGWDADKRYFTDHGTLMECYGIPYLFKNGFEIGNRIKEYTELDKMLASISKALPAMPNPKDNKSALTVTEDSEAKSTSVDTSGVTDAISEAEKDLSKQ